MKLSVRDKKTINYICHDCAMCLMGYSEDRELPVYEVRKCDCCNEITSVAKPAKYGLRLR